MTKQRAPLTFENALTTVAALIGWPATAKICGQKERTVRNWSDPDTSATITIDAALKLDAAFVGAGGEGPPFHLCYAIRLDADATAGCATSQAIIDATGKAAKESGEAVAAALIASRPNASNADLAIAERELEESISAHTGALAIIRASRGSFRRNLSGGRKSKGAARSSSARELA